MKSVFFSNFLTHLNPVHGIRIVLFFRVKFRFSFDIFNSCCQPLKSSSPLYANNKVEDGTELSKIANHFCYHQLDDFPANASINLSKGLMNFRMPSTSSCCVISFISIPSSGRLFNSRFTFLIFCSRLIKRNKMDRLFQLFLMILLFAILSHI